MLDKVGDGIWIAAGGDVSVLGFRYPTRMAVMRLAGGALVVWSPVALHRDLRQQIDALGTVAHVIAPNSLHHLALGEWQAAYPAAVFHAAPGLRGKRPDITFHRDLGDQPDPSFEGEIEQVVVRGNKITTEVVFFHVPSGTVLFTDLVQNYPKGWFRGWRAVVARLDLMVAPEASVPRKFRLAFTDRRAARSAIDVIQGWPAKLVLMAHGAPVTRDAQAFLDRAFRWLFR